MASFADQLARLRVAAATGHLPADLGAWAVRTLVDVAPEATRAALRNELLSQAAAALLPAGSTWARATALSAELAANGRRRRRGGSEVASLLEEALELDPTCPTSVRQLLRILASDMEGG